MLNALKNALWLFLWLQFCSLQLLANGDQLPAEQVGMFPREDSLVFVEAVAIDIDFGSNIYIVDRGRHQLLKFTDDGDFIQQVGGFGSNAEQFDAPNDVFAHTTLDVFIADYNNRRVVRYDKNLNFLSSLFSKWPEPYDFSEVISIAVSPQYDLFLLEEGSKHIVKFSRFSEPSASFGGLFETYGQLLEPVQLALDGNKQLFVSDPAQKTVVVFDYLGNYVTSLEHPDLQAPGGMHWGMDEQLYVVDSETSVIFLFDKHLKFKGQLRLAGTNGPIVDLTVFFERKSRSKTIFALSENACAIYTVGAK